MRNGDRKSFKGIYIEAYPAYNIKHIHSNGKPFHPKGEGNSYLVTFGDTRIFIGGDTKNVPEIKALNDIDVAFLPMIIPAMYPEEVANGALAMKPSILYHYHYSNTNPKKLVTLLQDQNDKLSNYFSVKFHPTVEFFS